MIKPKFWSKSIFKDSFSVFLFVYFTFFWRIKIIWLKLTFDDFRGQPHLLLRPSYPYKSIYLQKYNCLVAIQFITVSYALYLLRTWCWPQHDNLWNSKHIFILRRKFYRSIFPKNSSVGKKRHFDYFSHPDRVVSIGQKLTKEKESSDHKLGQAADLVLNGYRSTDVKYAIAVSQWNAKKDKWL